MDGFTDSDQQGERALVEQQADDDLRAVLATPAGRRFVYGLVFGACGLHSISCSGSPLLDAANDGKRMVGKGLKDQSKRVAFEHWLLAVTEGMRAGHAARTRSPGGGTLTP